MPYAPGRLLDCRSPVEWSHPLNRGLAGEWAVPSLPGWRGAGVLRDMTRGAGTPHDGTLSSPGVKWLGPTRAGAYGGLFLPNNGGAADYVDLGGAVQATLLGSFTVALWFWLSSGATPATVLFGAWAQSDARQLTYGQNATGLTAEDGGVAVLNSSGANVAGGTWHHACWAYDNVAHQSTLYQDGLAVSGPLTRTFAGGYTGHYYLGRNNGNEQQDIAVGACLVFGRALTAAEVAALYDQGRRGNPDRWRWLPRPAWPAPAAPASSQPYQPWPLLGPVLAM